MRSLLLSLTALCLCSSSFGQLPSADPAALVRQAMVKNTLTTPGAPPFHAVLDIQPDPKGPDAQHGRVELFWATPTHYILDVTSPEFSQHLVVDDDRIAETDQGDYYPAWLHYFVLALVNPFDRAEEILSHPNAAHDQPMYADLCYEWDSRRNVITEAERDADICFSKTAPQRIFTRDYRRFLELSNFQPFHDKSIARKYGADVRVTSLPQGTLSTLEDWKPDPSRLRVTTPTTAPRIVFRQRTATEATAGIVFQPKDVKWPVTRQGALTGKVLVHVVTDRNGKVREAAAPESDNEELKPFAAELAKQYVFRPEVVAGEAVQTEMPLIISFQMTEQKPLRVFNDAETRAMVQGCKLPKEIVDPASAGKIISIEMGMASDGHIGQIGSSDRKIAPPLLFQQFHDCHFAPFKEDGKPASKEDGKPASFRAFFNVLAK